MEQWNRKSSCECWMVIHWIRGSNQYKKKRRIWRNVRRFPGRGKCKRTRKLLSMSPNRTNVFFEQHPAHKMEKEFHINFLFIIRRSMLDLGKKNCWFMICLLQICRNASTVLELILKTKFKEQSSGFYDSSKINQLERI